MVTTLETPKNNIMQSCNSKQDHPGQENYKQPYKVIYHGLVHSRKYILISFLGNYPGRIDEKISAQMTAQGNIR